MVKAFDSQPGGGWFESLSGHDVVAVGKNSSPTISLWKKLISNTTFPSHFPRQDIQKTSDVDIIDVINFL